MVLFQYVAMKLNHRDTEAQSTTKSHCLCASVVNDDDRGVAQAIELTPFSRQPVRRAHQGSRDGPDVLAPGLRRVARTHERPQTDGGGATPTSEGRREGEEG